MRSFIRNSFIIFFLQFITAVISCSWFLIVSGFPTADEELGSLETVGNHTDWKIIARKARSEKRYNKKFWCKPYPRAQIIKMLGASPAAGSYGGYNPQYMALTWEEARKFPNLVANVSASPRKVSYIPDLPLRDPTRPSILTSRAECRKTEGGCVFYCLIIFFFSCNVFLLNCIHYLQLYYGYANYNADQSFLHYFFLV